jgi:hypothetical protein
VIDWRFWHDWFHETVIAGTYNWVSNIALNRYADQRGIDALANGLGTSRNGYRRACARSRTDSCARMRCPYCWVCLILGYLILK